MKIAIVDIDGTVADLGHRLHYVKGNHKDYDKFYNEVQNDSPIMPVIDLVRHLDNTGYTIVFMSGRNEGTREKTAEWLCKHVLLRASFSYEDNSGRTLYMRKLGDNRADDIVKEELLQQMLGDYKATLSDIKVVFDDRPRVVALWRRLGLPVFKVGSWDQEGPADDQKLPRLRNATLTLMVGPSGAGKSTFLFNMLGSSLFGKDAEAISSDRIRGQLLEDFRDQDKNAQVFAALHAMVKVRLEHGLDTVVDATNLRAADRKAITRLAPVGTLVQYVVIDRPVEQKIRDAGWRHESLIRKHHERFHSGLKNILSGDGNKDIKVLDFRSI